MSLLRKVSPDKGSCQEKNPRCPHCGVTLCWAHGKYLRKACHRPRWGPAVLIKAIPRFLCKHPKCGRTFSALPAGVIPYQRFFFSDFLAIAHKDAAGVNPYAIARDIEPEAGVSVVKRSLHRLRELLPWVKSLFREVVNQTSGSLGEMTGALLNTLPWPVFTGRWFRCLYPARFPQNLNPHNLALHG